MRIALPWAEDLSDRRVALFGEIRHWPSYHGMAPDAALIARGAKVHTELTPDLDYVVFGDGRLKGKAAAQRKAQALREQGAKLQILDEAGLIYLMRPKLRDARFHFAGELGLGQGAQSTSPAALLDTLGAMLAPEVDADLDFLVVCDRRAKGKAAAKNKAAKLQAQGAKLRIIDESAFMELMAAQAGAPESESSAPAGSSAGSSLAELVVALPGLTDPRRIQRALDMLRSERMQLYVDVDEQHAAGIVRSQTGFSNYYSSRIDADGRYSCCDEELNPCMGMGGKVCKHLLVLLLGLAQSGELPAATAKRWLALTKKRKPKATAAVSMEQLLADTILRYKAAEAGELDWRPTETVPEDYYAF